MELSNNNYGDSTMRTGSWSANSIEPDQTAQICRLFWFYTGGKG